MTRRIPVFATLVVLAAVATMIGLGIWQLQRLKWKEALLERYRSAETMNADVMWPQDAAAAEAALYRHATLDCLKTAGSSAVSGRNDKGQAGIAHVADCTLADGASAHVVLGWSTDPAPVAWTGGRVQGIVAPGPRLVASPPVAGLQPNARPDPADLPNNHFSYAMQWFFFAVTALVIYGLALRKRLKSAEQPVTQQAVEREGEKPRDQ